MNLSRTGLLLLIGSFALFGRLASQTAELSAGQTLAGRLEAADPTLPDGSHYQLFRYRGVAGDEVVIWLRSDDFDTYLSVGRMEDTLFVAENGDDDGGGGSNSRIRALVGPSGTIVIQANSYEGAVTGAFTLDLERIPSLSLVRRLILSGEIVTGRLLDSDPVMEDGSHFHIYVYRGAPGQRITLTLRSEAFDAYLSSGNLNGNSFVDEASDDDGGGGTDAMLVVSVGPSGEVVIRANSLDGGETGDYTLTVEASGPDTVQPGGSS